MAGTNYMCTLRLGEVTFCVKIFQSLDDTTTYTISDVEVPVVGKHC